jgi:thiol-disulfide isomerase/thioredoxin
MANAKRFIKHLGLPLLVVLIFIFVISLARTSLKDQDQAQSLSDYGFGRIGAFKTTDMRGNAVDESIFKEKSLTFINYWATWCGPCRDELPEFQSLYDQYKDKVAFVTIVDDGKDNAAAGEMAGAYLSSFINLLPEKNLVQPIMSGYVPTSVVVNNDGYLMLDQIIGSHSMEEYSSFLDKALELVEK